MEGQNNLSSWAFPSQLREAVFLGYEIYHHSFIRLLEAFEMKTMKNINQGFQIYLYYRIPEDFKHLISKSKLQIHYQNF